MERKDLVCIAQHIQSFVEQCKHDKPADFADPCTTCRYNLDCDFDAYGYFKELSSETGVQITPLILK